jgi:uncharacterized protein with PIN domain
MCAVIDFYSGSPMSEITLTENERVCKCCGVPVMKVAEKPRLVKTVFGGLLKVLIRCETCGRIGYVVRSISTFKVTLDRYANTSETNGPAGS